MSFSGVSEPSAVFTRFHFTVPAAEIVFRVRVSQLCNPFFLFIPQSETCPPSVSFFRGVGTVRRFTRFHSTVPAAEIVFRVSSALRDAGVAHTTRPASSKIKVDAEGEKGPLKCTVQERYYC